MKFWPRTLLWRTFLLLSMLMLLSVFAWFSIYKDYERVPRAQRLSQLLTSVVNLTRSALVTAHPDKRQTLLQELSEREGVRVYLAEEGEKIAPLKPESLLSLAAEQLRAKLGTETRVTLERNGERALFVNFRIDDDEYWVALPRERIERAIPWQWMGWGLAALLLSLAGAYLIVFRVTHPLKVLSKAAAEIGSGRIPPPVEESGPVEVATLAHAFNQMSSDLARLDSDRALILAGISHDLRTPLARLRMGIEMSGADDATRDGMIVDVEEMDQTIGQFLDFARIDNGTGDDDMQPTDLCALLENIATQYRRRGATIETDFGVSLRLESNLRPKAIHRAIANLIDNALRYAGTDAPIHLTVNQTENETRIAVMDRGSGIPSAEAERMKLPFTRLDAARGNASGAGLGLAIVDRITRAHGGSFQLSARDGGGLVAEIVLPLNQIYTQPCVDSSSFR